MHKWPIRQKNKKNIATKQARPNKTSNQVKGRLRLVKTLEEKNKSTREYIATIGVPGNGEATQIAWVRLEGFAGQHEAMPL